MDDQPFQLLAVESAINAPVTLTIPCPEAQQVAIADIVLTFSGAVAGGPTVVVQVGGVTRWTFRVAGTLLDIPFSGRWAGQKGENVSITASAMGAGVITDMAVTFRYE